MGALEPAPPGRPGARVLHPGRPHTAPSTLLAASSRGDSGRSRRATCSRPASPSGYSGRWIPHHDRAAPRPRPAVTDQRHAPRRSRSRLLDLEKPASCSAGPGDPVGHRAHVPRSRQGLHGRLMAGWAGRFMFDGHQVAAPACQVGSPRARPPCGGRSRATRPLGFSREASTSSSQCDCHDGPAHCRLMWRAERGRRPQLHERSSGSIQMRMFLPVGLRSAPGRRSFARCSRFARSPAGPGRGDQSRVERAAWPRPETYGGGGG
jgi:hypothetical protein